MFSRPGLNAYELMALRKLDQGLSSFPSLSERWDSESGGDRGYCDAPANEGAQPLLNQLLGH
jgi:hypothetical protein